MTDHHRDMERLRRTLPVNPVTSAPLIAGTLSLFIPFRRSASQTVSHVCVCVCVLDFSPALTSTHLNAAVDPLPGELHARLALIKHTAEKVQYGHLLYGHLIPSFPK